MSNSGQFSPPTRSITTSTEFSPNAASKHSPNKRLVGTGIQHRLVFFIACHRYDARATGLCSCMAIEPTPPEAPVMSNVSFLVT